MPVKRVGRLPRLYAPLTIGKVKGGTPLTLDAAISTLEKLDAKESRLFKNQKKYDEWNRVAGALERLENSINLYGDVLAERERQAMTAFAPTRKAQEQIEREQREDRQVEWQFGRKYSSKARGHNVDVNIDLRREDGKRIPRSEVVDVFQQYIATGYLQDGYEIAGVDWRSAARERSGKGFKRGEESDLSGSLSNIVFHTKLNDWRVGGIQ